MSVDMSQFHGVFFEESHEHLSDMEHLLLNISPQAPDTEALNSIFRAAHSIKGGSGIFGFDALTGLTHVMESMLDKARNQQLQLSTEIVNTLLQTCDQLASILEAYQNEGDIDWAAIEQGIQALESVNPSVTRNATDEKEQGFGFFETTDNMNSEEDFGFFDDLPPNVKNTADDDDEVFGFFEPIATPKKSAAPQQPPAEVESTTDTPRVKPKKAPVKAKDTTEASSIRVDTSKIDSLMNLVGELVITQSILRVAGDQASGNLAELLESAIDGLSRNVRDIQESVMSMRMIPISFVFNRFPRLVRDLSAKLDKKIDLVIEGGTTEIDKGVIEKLVDPLTHLVRNSIDHGIETTERRGAANKPEVGRIVLNAEQRGGNVLITIKDDGGGMNREKILEKAVSNGIQVSENIADKGVWKLIFEPGFSTADTVTDVSGRGVGMDVVRRNIEAINGVIDIHSEYGIGSEIVITLPLTLAILDGMCVSVSGQIFIIPLTSIIESMQPSEAQIKTIGNDRLLWVRDHYWPIVPLHKELNISGATSEPADAVVVLIESSQRRFALLVDRLEGQQQVVVKSLEQHYRRVDNVAGATIMGDGSVALILDIESLSKSASQAHQLEADYEPEQ